VRISLRYGNLETLEEGYGINLLPLATFAIETYTQEDLDIYAPKIKFATKLYTEKEKRIYSQMHKAICVIQWKLEGQIIKRNPSYKMDDRLLLDKMNLENGTIEIDGVNYKLTDSIFPTINPNDPYALTDEEANIVTHLHSSFVNSEKLRKHVYCLLQHGSYYLARNNNLMYHASIPMNKDGSFKDVEIMGEYYSGKRLLDRLDELVQIACRKSHRITDDKRYSVDYMWYLWCGPDSPSFDKSKMATLERYLIAEKETHKEHKGYYYTLCDSEEVCNKILKEFGLPTTGSHIINGHIPVKTIKGENPVKANGKLLVIDGGFSRAYQPETGIAGYTLVFHSRGLQLVQHEPFESRQKAIEEGQDIISNTVLSEFNSKRLMVRDTDKGRELVAQVEDLHNLLTAYRHGLIKEHE
jgi:fructose-1,6-bisphosphatase-3